ncbi:MAG: type II toxin-antitoxin system RelE/ParE family toxin [Rhodoferax sp.]
MNAPQVRLGLHPQAWADIERLEEFLLATQDPLQGALVDFLLEGMAVLRWQPAIGRPVMAGLYRELIVERGRNGYLLRYHYDRALQRVVVLRIRHQRECGYLEADAADDIDNE